ncbi:hypothetical protein [Simkania sp.]|uniref:hypothetical protein n=1 Tax=Simkania sp. TaxID=34094 RepID=UPI003B51BFD9
MSSEMKVKAVDGVTGSSATEPPKFSIAQGFTDLKSLLHPEQSYDYTYFGGGKIRLSSSEFSADVMEGMLYFCNWLPHDSYTEHLTTFSTSTENLQAAATACAQIATSTPEVTVAEFATAVRKTLRDAKNTLYTRHEAIPPKVYGQLLACLVFVKTLPELPENMSKSADTLLGHMRNIGVTKNTDAIYYHVRDDLSTHFQKDGSWTKTGNALFGWAIGYRV